MSPYLWFFAALALLILLLTGLFLYFCKGNVLAKAISTILVLFASVGGTKVTPEYTGNLRFSIGSFAFDGQVIVGGSRTDTTILIVVLGVSLLALLGSFTYLKYHGRI